MHERAKRIDTVMASAFSDGTTIFKGVVSNISKTGLKITHIPSKFRPSTRKYSTLIKINNKKFRFMIMPVWFNKRDYRLEIGFKIVSAPSGWLKFINQTIAESDLDSTTGTLPVFNPNETHPFATSLP